MTARICKVLNVIIVVILIAIAAIMIGPKLMNGQTLAVLSGSMEPEIPVGSLVIIQETNPQKLETGDVITFRVSSSTLVTHRIVNIDNEKEEIVTKGDANDVNDGNPVTYDNIVGKMLFHVPLLGYLTIYMQTPLGIAILCGLVLVLILLNYLPDLVKKENS